MTKTQPLQGVRIVDLGWRLVAPLAARTLAWGGAEVIHVESGSRHDGMRMSAPLIPGKEGMNVSHTFNNANTNKLSITLNLSKPLAKDIVKRLVAISDVVIENFSAGVMDRLGFGYETLRELRPDLIMVSHSLSGLSGPWQRVNGHGPMGAAMAGMHYISGWPDMDPIAPGGAYTDLIVNPQHSSFAVIAALLHRRRTGQGQYIDLCQYESIVNSAGPTVLEYTTNKTIYERQGNREHTAAPHGVYQCIGDDRWCAISVSTIEEWEALLAVMNRQELAQDQRFLTLNDRKANEDTLDSIIEEWTSVQEVFPLVQQLQDAGVAAGVVQNSQDLAGDKQLSARGHYHHIDHPEAGVMPHDGLPFRMSHSHTEVRPAPMLGEHNDYIFRELLDLSEEEIINGYVDDVFV